jgi:hypothetical protein
LRTPLPGAGVCGARLASHTLNAMTCWTSCRPGTDHAEALLRVLRAHKFVVELARVAREEPAGWPVPVPPAAPWRLG